MSTFQNMWDATKVVLKREMKFIILNGETLLVMCPLLSSTFQILHEVDLVFHEEFISKVLSFEQFKFFKIN